MTDTHAADLAGEPASKARRKKSTSPTARTLAECRKRGWIAGVVERHIPFPKPQGTKIDLFGVIDLVVIVPDIPGHHERSDHGGDGPCASCRSPAGILAIQATASAAHHAHRRAKILAEPRAKAWVDAGGRLELWSWSQRGGRGKAKRWSLRVETYAEMAGVGEAGIQQHERIRELERALADALNRWSADMPDEDPERERLRALLRKAP